VMSKKQWIASDGTSSQPWIILSPSANLKLTPGYVVVTGGGNQILALLDVGPLTFQKVGVMKKATLEWWDPDWDKRNWGFYGDASIAWTIHRRVSCKITGLEVVATFAGVADAKNYKDMDQREDGSWTHAGGWDAECGTCLAFSVEVSLGDKKSLKVKHNFLEKLEMKDRSDPCLEVPELGVKGCASAGWASTAYTIEVGQNAPDPVHALIIGFILARYMHPHRAEEAGAIRKPVAAGKSVEAAAAAEKEDSDW